MTKWTNRFGVLEDSTFAPTEIRVSAHGKDMDLRVTISSVARCGGLTVLKKGLAMGIITASQKAVEYDDDGTDDGRRVLAGILTDEVDLTDGSSDGITAVDQPAVIMRHGAADESACTGVDANSKEDPVGRQIDWR